MKTAEMMILAGAAVGVFLLLRKFGGAATSVAAPTASGVLTSQRNAAYADWARYFGDPAASKYSDASRMW